MGFQDAAFVAIAASPLSPGESPVRLRFRDAGAGPPVVLLHGGWGYDIYPYDSQVAALAPIRRIVAPDRTGYGGSGRLRAQPADFHQRAAEETLAFVDALGLERPVVWGHSDGAVIALRIGLMAPDRIGGIIAEATHFYRDKPSSRGFFEMMRDNPDQLGARVTTILARDHGERWRALIQMNGEAWLRIAEQGGDLYDGRLAELRLPTLVVHGGADPRTEPGELNALRRNVPHARFVVLADGGHSPHSDRATAAEVTRLAIDFLSTTGGGSGTDRGRIGDGPGTDRGRTGDGSGTDRGRIGDGPGTDRGRIGDRLGTDRGRIGDRLGTDWGQIGDR